MIKLNLGCGKDIQDGYINIDLRYTHPRVMICDVTNLDSRFEDETVDEIRAIDVLEHIEWSKTLSVLKNWCKKLKPNGILIIQSPCLKLLAKKVLDSKNPIEVENCISRIFGGQNYKENFHYTAIDETLIKYYLSAAGFSGKPTFETKFGNRTNIRIKVRK